LLEKSLKSTKVISEPIKEKKPAEPIKVKKPAPPENVKV
jgi:hypothetical protein